MAGETAFGALNEAINPTQHNGPLGQGGERGDNGRRQIREGRRQKKGRQKRGERVPSVLAGGLPENLHLAQVSGGHGLVDLLLVFVRQLDRRRRKKEILSHESGLK